jgi:rfaE bifunctional protein kinase chain/domain
MKGLDSSIFNGKKVLVIGDVMLDIHHFGKMERHSAEAPIQIHDIEQIEMNPGGAANVAINLHHLGIEAVLLSIIGRDYYGKVLKGLLSETGVNSTYQLDFEYLNTTVKSRFYVNGQQVFRSDLDSRVPRDKEVEVCELLMTKAEKSMPKVDMVLIQDYNKGIFNSYLIPRLLGLAEKYKKPVLVDPKLSNVNLYKGVKLLKPNLREFSDMMGKELMPEKELLDEAAADWMLKHRVEQLLVTLSEKGVYFRDEHQSGILSGYKVNQPDVSGAGDTVLAVTAACTLMGMSLPEIARYANAAGAYVCTLKGIKPVNWEGINSLLK